MGFPDHGLAIDHGRHLAVGIELQIVAAGVVELAAVILAGVGRAGLLEEEQHLLHIAGGGAAQNSQHSDLSLSGLRGGVSRRRFLVHAFGL